MKRDHTPSDDADDTVETGQQAFRRTFLYNFTRHPDGPALAIVGDLLLECALDMAGQWPDWPESATRARLRALLADLRYAESFLVMVAREHRDSELSDADCELSLFALDVLPELTGLVTAIAERLGPAPADPRGREV